MKNNTIPAAGTKAANTIEELYAKYEDDSFDWKTFNAEPEMYPFTEDDIMYQNLLELERYEAEVPMTPAEKRALRKWVASGHCVRESPGSRYALTSREQDFLDVYRMDREIRHELRGKTKAECEEYLKAYRGKTDDEYDPDIDVELPETEGDDPFGMKKKISGPFNPKPEKKGAIERKYMDQRWRNRELFYLWMFIANEGLQEEAREYLKENMDEPVPFEE